MPACVHSRLSHQTNAATPKPPALSPALSSPPRHSSPYLPPFNLLEHSQAASYPPSVHTAREKDKLNAPPLPIAYPANPPAIVAFYYHRGALMLATNSAVPIGSPQLDGHATMHGSRGRRGRLPVVNLCITPLPRDSWPLAFLLPCRSLPFDMPVTECDRRPACWLMVYPCYQPGVLDSGPTPSLKTCQNGPLGGFKDVFHTK